MGSQPAVAGPGPFTTRAKQDAPQYLNHLQTSLPPKHPDSAHPHAKVKTGSRTRRLITIGFVFPRSFKSVNAEKKTAEIARYGTFMHHRSARCFVLPLEYSVMVALCPAICLLFAAQASVSPGAFTRVS